jgi:hypothetical protein
MSTTSIYQAATLTLMQPIQLDDQPSISQVTLSMLTHGQHKSIVDAHEGDSTVIYRELIKLGTGLKESVLIKLLVPDYNSLLDLAEEHYGNNSLYWFEKSHQSMSEDVSTLTLLQPLKCLEGEFDALPLTFPTLEVLDMMGKQAESKKDDFIKESITGLSIKSLRELSVPDWRMLDVRITDFLSQTGDFFLAKMTKNSSSIT